jgi:LPS O-antigen subunit length determinant protein (WzzB/FepE family)
VQPILVKIIIIVSLISAVFLTHTWRVNKAVDKAVAEQVAIYNNKIKELEIKSLKAESQLKDKVQSIKGEKDAQIKSIDRKYNSAIVSLRNRKERSTSTNSTPSACNAESTQGATGAQLYRNDAEVLIRFARDAEELKTHLNACYQQYDTVKEQLDNYRK